MKTLIVKTGALGDVVRTTVLLHDLAKEGTVEWLTKKNASELLQSGRISRKYFVDSEQDMNELRNSSFDMIINLEENRQLLEFVGDIRKLRLIGPYLQGNEIRYTENSAYWFDMSMISKYGKSVADELKRNNQKSVPQILTEMTGREFTGQEYDLGIPGKNVDPRKVGIISLCGDVWKNKQWTGYEALENRLKNDGFDVNYLSLRPALAEHIEDIDNCGLIVCGDTLGMHLALALKKKVVALFNCTSPHEIEGYGRLEKVVSPLYDEFFYAREFSEKAISATPVEEVYNRVKKII